MKYTESWVAQSFSRTVSRVQLKGYLNSLNRHHHYSGIFSAGGLWHYHELYIPVFSTKEALCATAKHFYRQSQIFCYRVVYRTGYCQTTASPLSFYFLQQRPLSLSPPNHFALNSFFNLSYLPLPLLHILASLFNQVIFDGPAQQRIWSRAQLLPGYRQ